jgi:hypothetical protein
VITDAAPQPAGALRWTPGRRLWAQWAATRALMLLLLIPEHKVLGDVRYYFAQLDALFHGGGPGGTLREYPVPAVGVLALPRLVSGHSVTAYLAAFVVAMLAVDAALTCGLFRAAQVPAQGSARGSAQGPARGAAQGAQGAAPGVRLWLWVPPLLGPMIVCRFDLVPAALAAGALLALGRRPALAGALVGLGAAVKLWPAALLPSLWLHRTPGERGRWRLLAAFGAVAGAAVLVAAVLAGSTRLLSPLHWQGERGLQLEAYAALPLLVADLFRPDRWQVAYTRFYAFQVTGPGTGAAMTAATVSSGLAVLLLAVLWLRAARLREAMPPAVVGLLGALTVCLIAVTDKTLSPQYLIWVAALLAVVGVSEPDPAAAARDVAARGAALPGGAAREVAARGAALPGGAARGGALPRGANPLLLATCALTQVIFPLNYDPLVAGEPYAVVLLILRDAGLLAVAWLVGRRVWALTGRPTRQGGTG